MPSVQEIDTLLNRIGSRYSKNQEVQGIIQEIRNLAKENLKLDFQVEQMTRKQFQLQPQIQTAEIPAPASTTFAQPPIMLAERTPENIAEDIATGFGGAFGLQPLAEKLRGRPPVIGETAQDIAKFGGEAVALVTGGKALGLIKPLAKLPSFIRTAGLGGGLGAVEKLPEGASRLSNVLSNAVIFGGFDVVLSGLGKYVAKPILKRLAGIKDSKQIIGELQKELSDDELKALINIILLKKPSDLTGGINVLMTLTPPIAEVTAGTLLSAV